MTFQTNQILPIHRRVQDAYRGKHSSRPILALLADSTQLNKQLSMSAFGNVAKEIVGEAWGGKNNAPLLMKKLSNNSKSMVLHFPNGFEAFRLDFSASGGEAYKLIQYERYDLVLASTALSKIGGKTLAEKIKSGDSKNKSVKMIAFAHIKQTEASSKLYTYVLNQPFDLAILGYFIHDSLKQLSV